MYDTERERIIDSVICGVRAAYKMMISAIDPIDHKGVKRIFKHRKNHRVKRKNFVRYKIDKLNVTDFTAGVDNKYPFPEPFKFMSAYYADSKAQPTKP